MNPQPDIQWAADLLHVRPAELTPFSETDAFNPGNVIDGFICHRNDHRYGALVITKVNGFVADQVIFATPKLKYPFDKNGEFIWPPLQTIEVYEKLDGTNILAYRYTDGEKHFVTFKTRLTAVVKDSAFGAFRSMWKEMLEAHDWIGKAINDNPDFNLSFELYGSRNLITVQYTTTLDTKLLFGVNRTFGYVVPPINLVVDEKHTTLERSASITQNQRFLEPTELYTNCRQLSRWRNIYGDDGETEFSTEGHVLYASLHTGYPGAQNWQMFKCKPEEIEKIHWMASGQIPRNAIWTTAVNAYESFDDPTVEDLHRLLMEDFTDQQIKDSMERITQLYKKVRDHMVKAKRANEAWAKAKEAGFDLRADKAATMRYISQFFKKNEMRFVGSVILKQAGLL